MLDYQETEQKKVTQHVKTIFELTSLTQILKTEHDSLLQLHTSTNMKLENLEDDYKERVYELYEMTQLKEKLNVQYDKYFEKAERYKVIMKQLKT